MKDSENRLEVCKLEINPPDPHLQTICFLELPPLIPGVSFVSPSIFVEWVPTSRNYTRTRSSRASHAHFYSSTVGTMALCLDYYVLWETKYGDPYFYALIIDVEALLFTIRTGVRNVPWADWGPSSTHLFKRTVLCPAGPSWITGLSPLVLRQYYPRRTRYTQSMLENTSSPSRTGPQVFSSEAFGKLWDNHSIKTNLPYRDVVVNDINLGRLSQILSDREWVVGITKAEVRGFCVCILEPLRCEADYTRQQMEGSSVRITVYHLA